MKHLKLLLLLSIVLASITSCSDTNDCDVQIKAIQDEYDKFFESKPNLTQRDRDRYILDMKGKLESLDCN